jgi:hypothetical protein
MRLSRGNVYQGLDARRPSEMRNPCLRTHSRWLLRIYGVSILDYPSLLDQTSRGWGWSCRQEGGS